MFCNVVIPLSDNSVSQGVKLQTTSETLSAQCGENLALTCEATSSQPLDIKLFTWLARNKTVCQYEDGQHDPEVLCESDAKAPHYQLTLTLLNVMPVHQGNYLCKIQSDRGGKSATTHVTVQGQLTFNMFCFFFFCCFLLSF